MKPTRKRSATQILFTPAFLVAAISLAGCNGGTPAPPAGDAAAVPDTGAAATTPSQSAPQAATTPKTDGDIGRPRRQNERWADASGVEYLGNVPLDVFFDQPYAVVQDSTPIGGGATSTPPVGDMSSPGPPTQTPVEDTTETAAAGGGDWSELMPIATLKEEVNSVRNFMNQSLQTVGAYNSSMLMIPPKAATIAALATIAMEHPEDVTWKEDAKYVRDFAKQMNEDALQRGKKDQVRLLTLFENISDTLNRSKPADLTEPPEEDSYVDVAEMRLLMMRMESAEKRMKNEAGSETAFGSQKEMILHESAMLGTMTKVVTMEGYGYADDEEFLGYAKRITDAAMAIRTAVEVNDFAAYELTLSKVATACTECHSAFKNN